jgi:hypothetical protein
MRLSIRSSACASEASDCSPDAAKGSGRIGFTGRVKAAEPDRISLPALTTDRDRAYRPGLCPVSGYGVGAIRYGWRIVCFSCCTVTQSSLTMPPVSPELGFHAQ